MKVKLSEIVIDPNIIVRQSLDTHAIASYADSMRAGDKFPEMVLDNKNRLVCGHTRYHAYRRILEPDDMVNVIIKKFNDEAELIEFAASDNSRHGQPFSTWDKKNITSKLLSFGFSINSIAKTLAMSEEKIEEWSGMRVTVIKGRGKNRIEESLPIKHGVEHLIGEEVSPEAYESHARHDYGVKVSVLARQITSHINHDWINVNNPNTVSALSELRDALNCFFVEVLDCHRAR